MEKGKFFDELYISLIVLNVIVLFSDAIKAYKITKVKIDGRFTTNLSKHNTEKGTQIPLLNFFKRYPAFILLVYIIPIGILTTIGLFTSSDLGLDEFQFENSARILISLSLYYVSTINISFFFYFIQIWFQLWGWGKIFSRFPILYTVKLQQLSTVLSALAIQLAGLFSEEHDLIYPALAIQINIFLYDKFFGLLFTSILSLSGLPSWPYFRLICWIVSWISFFLGTLFIVDFYEENLVFLMVFSAFGLFILLPGVVWVFNTFSYVYNTSYAYNDDVTLHTEPSKKSTYYFSYMRRSGPIASTSVQQWVCIFRRGCYLDKITCSDVYVEEGANEDCEYSRTHWLNEHQLVFACCCCFPFDLKTKLENETPVVYLGAQGRSLRADVSVEYKNMIFFVDSIGFRSSLSYLNFVPNAKFYFCLSKYNEVDFLTKYQRREDLNNEINVAIVDVDLKERQTLMKSFLAIDMNRLLEDLGRNLTGKLNVVAVGSGGHCLAIYGKVKHNKDIVFYDLPISRAGPLYWVEQRADCGDANNCNIHL